MAGPLGKLVHLTSLDLRCTWHGGVGCVSRVCMHAAPCPSVRGRLWQCEAVWLTGGVAVCVGGHQTMGWVKRGQQLWRVRWASWCT